MNENMWDQGLSVWITSFWGWSPDTWGTVGFTQRGRRETVLQRSTDPFIVVGYVTKTAHDRNPDIRGNLDLRGKITGFYVVSHVKGHRNDFTATRHHERNPDQWVYSLKAIRAFSFVPEYRASIDDFDPTIARRARSVGSSGEELDEARIAKLRSIPYVEVTVFGGPEIIFADIQVPIQGPHMVKSGPANRAGYTVSGEPPDTEKELYALVLNGDTSKFLGKPAQGQRIFKIGLSISPKIRLDAFQKTLPKGAFGWDLYRWTRGDGHKPYPNFEAAEAGERAMKEYLGKAGRWLNGEFYSATDSIFEAAWQAGRHAALAHASAINIVQLLPNA